MAIPVKFRVISDNEIVGYERIFNGEWQWMCPELNPDNGERWTRGCFPEVAGHPHIRTQFTGRADKQGNEIYLGDVFGSPALRCAVDQKDDGAFILRFVDKRIKEISILDRKVATSRVIGNIFQNPELIQCQQSTPA